MRDLIAGTFGLQHLDNFITRIYQTLENQKELLEQDKLDLLMTYNPERAISNLHHKKPRTNNLILLGNKGYQSDPAGLGRQAGAARLYHHHRGLPLLAGGEGFFQGQGRTDAAAPAVA